MRFFVTLLFAGWLASSCEALSGGLPKNHGKVAHQLFLAGDQPAPLIVAFGGSEGGMVFATERTAVLRDSLLALGYHFLALGYFGLPDTPKYLDRISLDAIHDTIMSVSHHPLIDAERILLFGGSRGGELILNLAARYDDYAGVLALVPAHVSLPSGVTKRATSSWTFGGSEVPFIPITKEAVQVSKKEGFYEAFSLMVEASDPNGPEAIAVEKIMGPILLVSASEDEIWPCLKMCDLMVDRLERSGFSYPVEHVTLEGGHGAVADDHRPVFQFLMEHFSTN